MAGAQVWARRSARPPAKSGDVRVNSSEPGAALFLARGFRKGLRGAAASLRPGMSSAAAISAMPAIRQVVAAANGPKPSAAAASANASASPMSFSLHSRRASLALAGRSTSAGARGL